MVGLERLAGSVETGVLEKDDVPLLKALLAEDNSQVDRAYGKTTQRQVIDSHSTSTHVDVAELMKASREDAKAIEAAPVVEVDYELGAVEDDEDVDA